MGPSGATRVGISRGSGELVLNAVSFGSPFPELGSNLANLANLGGLQVKRCQSCNGSCCGSDGAWAGGLLGAEFTSYLFQVCPSCLDSAAH